MRQHSWVANEGEEEVIRGSHEKHGYKEVGNSWTQKVISKGKKREKGGNTHGLGI